MEEAKEILHLLDSKFNDKIINLEDNSKRELSELKNLNESLVYVQNLLIDCSNSIYGIKNESKNNIIREKTINKYSNIKTENEKLRPLSRNNLNSKINGSTSKSSLSPKKNLLIDEENNFFDKEKTNVAFFPKKNREKSNNLLYDKEYKFNNSLNITDVNNENESIDIKKKTRRMSQIDNNSLVKHTISPQMKIKSNEIGISQKGKNLLHSPHYHETSGKDINKQINSKSKFTSDIQDEKQISRFLITESVNLKKTRENKSSIKYNQKSLEGSIISNKKEIKSSGISPMASPKERLIKHRKTNSHISEYNNQQITDVNMSYNFGILSKTTEQNYFKVENTNSDIQTNIKSKRVSVIDGNIKKFDMKTTAKISNIPRGIYDKSRKRSVQEKYLNQSFGKNFDRGSKEKKILLGGHGKKNQTEDESKIISEEKKIKQIRNFFQIKNFEKILRIRSFLEDFNKENSYKILNRCFFVIDLKENLLKNLCDKKNDLEKNLISFKNKYKEDEIFKEPQPFSVGKATQKAIEILNEPLHHKFYEAKIITHPDIIKAYKIYLIFLGKEKIYEIHNQDLFFEKFCEFLLDNSNGKLGDFILSSIKDLDFSSETIFKITKLYGKDFNKINQSFFSKMCTTTSLFSFLLKDALEYCGIVFVEKKSQLQKVYNSNLYFIDTLDVKISRLDNLISKILG